MNFKNKFNKLRQYSEYFGDLSDAEIPGLLGGANEKISAIEDLSKEAKDISAEIAGAIMQSIKTGLGLKNINVKKLKKAFSELKALAKSERLPAEDKQAVELMAGLTELFIENNSSTRNW